MPEKSAYDIQPHELIPATLAEIVSSKQVQIYNAAPHDPNLNRYLITDNQPFIWRQFDKFFTFFDQESIENLDLKTHPNLRPIVNFSLAHRDPLYLDLETLDVNANLHRRGIGSLMTEKINRVARKHHYPYLVAFQGEDSVTKFFLQNGFYLWKELTPSTQSQLQTLRTHPLFTSEFACTVRPTQTESIQSAIIPKIRRLTIPQRLS